MVEVSIGESIVHPLASADELEGYQAHPLSAERPG
jgi:hypothetical protein